MKKRICKILSYLPPIFLDYFEMIFSSAAENHMRIANSENGKYRSYTQLKRHQKKVRMSIGVLLLIVVSAFLGVMTGPLLFPQPIESEIYIPNGKADILLANVSKNQATVVFKTLDSANGNKPLATKAIVEFYTDSDFTKLERRSNEDDYAVTHIIPVDSLQEGTTYFIKITAKDASTPQHTKTVSSWGDGNDPIKVFTTGDLITNCSSVIAKNNSVQKNDQQNNYDVKIPGSLDSTSDSDNLKTNTLQAFGVRNESHLQPGNKVQTIITWDTVKPAKTSLLYGENSENEKNEVQSNDQMQTKHQVVLTTLAAGKTYYFKIKTPGNNGEDVISDEYSLRTPKPSITILEKIAENFKAIMKQIKPW